MATLHLSGATTVADLKKQFNESFGSQIRVYAGNKVAELTATLSTIGLTKDGDFECVNSMTAASFAEQIKADFGIKVKVYTCDEWVAVLGELTLEMSGKVKKSAVKADMEKMLANVQTDTTINSGNIGGYKVVAKDDGGYSVYKDGVLCDNAKGAMREIAAIVGLEVDPAWTTRQLGSKLQKIAGGETATPSAPKPAEPEQKDNTAEIEDAKAKAELEKQKAAAEAEKAKAELERQKAEAEAAKADAEKAKAETAAMNAAKAELEKQKTEADAVKAELEKQKSEMELAKAEIDRLKAELLKTKEETTETSKKTAIVPKEESKVVDNKKETAAVVGDIFEGQMISIKGGTFMQESKGRECVKNAWDEYPGGDHRRKPIYHPATYQDFRNERKVTVPDFMISKFLVTKAQWYSICKPNEENVENPDFPVLLNIYDTISFLQKLPHPEGVVYDLPTEIQWTYAALGGKSEFSDKDSSDEYCSSGKISVGTKKPNSYGLFDMLGNVSERCRDKYILNLGVYEKVEEPFVNTDTYYDRVICGDSYHQRGSGRRDSLYGFRVVLRPITAEETEREQKEKARLASISNFKQKTPEGALTGLFSVGKDKTITFAKGNLQFNPKKYEFRFAEHQYDIIGKGNDNIAMDYDGWIDLFGYGASGHLGCDPSESSDSDSKYPNNGISNTNFDWGVNNPISNGGNQKGLWRTLTENEFKYIMQSRENSGKLFGKACVNGINGLIILPDDFNCENIDVAFVPYDKDDTSVKNIYNKEQWAEFESIGALFLPNAGARKNTSVNLPNNWYYWTGDYSSNNSTPCGIILDLNFSCDLYYLIPIFIGCSVRLVQDIK